MARRCARRRSKGIFCPRSRSSGFRLIFAESRYDLSMKPCRETRVPTRLTNRSILFPIPLYASRTERSRVPRVATRMRTMRFKRSIACPPGKVRNAIKERSAKKCHLARNQRRENARTRDAAFLVLSPRLRKNAERGSQVAKIDQSRSIILLKFDRNWSVSASCDPRPASCVDGATM